MNRNLEELTDKIYREGIEKAEERGQQLVGKAKIEAQQIIAEAEKRATSLISQAEKECSELSKRSEAEMKLASRQALSVLKQKISDMLMWEVVSGPVKKTFNDEEFVKRTIEKMIDNWVASIGQEENITVLLSPRNFDALQIYFGMRAQEILQNTVEIKASSQMKDGFKIAPEDGRFKISFTSEDFENYFVNYARPRVYELLFGDQES